MKACTLALMKIDRKNRLTSQPGTSTTHLKKENLIAAKTRAAPATQLEIATKVFFIVDALRAYSAGIDRAAGSTPHIRGAILPDVNPVASGRTLREVISLSHSFPGMASTHFFQAYDLLGGRARLLGSSPAGGRRGLPGR